MRHQRVLEITFSFKVSRQERSIQEEALVQGQKQSSIPA